MTKLLAMVSMVFSAPPDAPTGAPSTDSAAPPPLTADERSELEKLRAESKATQLATEISSGGALPKNAAFSVVSHEKDKKPSGWIDQVMARVKQEHIDGDEGDLTEDEKSFLVQLADRRYNDGNRKIDALDLNYLAAISAKLGFKPRHVAPVSK